MKVGNIPFFILNIYIPLWFYSNERISEINEFDFSIFTFHYGSIQIICETLSGLSESDLHSTMVLFK